MSTRGTQVRAPAVTTALRGLRLVAACAAVVVACWSGAPTSNCDNHPPPGSPDPSLHEPPNFRPLSDESWKTFDAPSWSYLRRTSSRDDDVVEDESAPQSRPGVLRIVFTTDMRPDAEPSVHWTCIPGSRAVYAAWWIKLSPNWSSSPAGGGKIAFLWAPDGQGQAYTGFFGSTEPHHISVNTEWSPYGQKIWDPNVTSTDIYYGKWYRIEWLMSWESSPGARDGVVRWWVDGVLNGDYSNLQFPVCCFRQFEFAPTLQHPPPAEQYMYVDHTYLSVPRSDDTPPADSGTPPAAPRASGR